MNRQKWWLFTSIGFILVTLTLSIFLIIGSEVVFYLSKGAWYFSLNKPKVSLDKAKDMSLYREPFPVKKGDRLRILAIGGSTTYGFGVDAKFTWPALLAQKLEENFPGKYEVINLGRLGGHLEEFIQNYYASSNVYIPRDKWVSSSEARPSLRDCANWGWKDLQPDVVLLVPIVNDTAPDYLFFSKPNSIAKIANGILNVIDKSFFSNYLAVGFYIKKALVILESRNREPPANESQKLAVIKSQYKGNLERFIDLWDRKIPFYLFRFPLLFNGEDRDKEARLAGRFWNIPDTVSLLEEIKYFPKLEGIEKNVCSELSRKYKLRYMEIGADIKKWPFSKRLRLYVDSIHMNSQGTRMLADQIYDFVFDSSGSLR